MLAEELGYYGFYYGESLTEIDLDCWTVLSTLIPITNKIKLGPVITYILPEYRSMALLVKQSITFQDISKGRLEFRTGAGASLEYSLQWWYPFGINYSNTTQRVALFNEGIQLLSKLLGNNDTNYSQSGSTLVANFDGQFYKIRGASFVKSKIRIPITIAAKQDKMMKTAANYADTWECSYLTPNEYFTLNQKFESLSKKRQNNKDPRESQNRAVKRSIELDVLIASTEQELDYKKKLFAMGRGSRVYAQILKKGLVGNSAQVCARIQEYVDLGINQFFLAFQDPFDLKSIELFMDAVKSRKT
ncbi:MAG: LLM class flavin-dependent oxidoreductase [Candidatus Nitrosocosmicus sp.]|nr:LLM class flavin-dependent oxidoreductase [Candidatus Nitrosocosmicus sp.]MDN5867089.1 LLM class flavin-dependent oxidoreductase [Candidatus Nitrosocosmicus sp.]